jgi:hypothetical protein
MGPWVRSYARRGDEPVFPVDNRLSKTVDSTPSEVLIDGPGVVDFVASHAEESSWEAWNKTVSYSVVIRPVGTDRSMVLVGDLPPWPGVPEGKPATIWRAQAEELRTAHGTAD